jgi:hypothetical protein
MARHSGIRALTRDAFPPLSGGTISACSMSFSPVAARRATSSAAACASGFGQRARGYSDHAGAKLRPRDAILGAHVGDYLTLSGVHPLLDSCDSATRRGSRGSLGFYADNFWFFLNYRRRLAPKQEDFAVREDAMRDALGGSYGVGEGQEKCGHPTQPVASRARRTLRDCGMGDLVEDFLGEEKGRAPDPECYQSGAGTSSTRRAASAGGVGLLTPLRGCPSRLRQLQSRLT